MDTKKDLWDYTKEKYIIPEAAKAWTLVTIREAWRSHRAELKRKYYDPYDNDEVRMSKKPGHIPECQFRELLKYWKSEKFLEKEKETVSSTELFGATRTRNPNRVYKASYENIASKIAEMEELETQVCANGQSVDSFSAIMGSEHAGCLRLYGAGVTKTTLKKIVGNSEPTLNATNGAVKQMEERIQKMEKQMEEQKRTMRQEVIADVIAQLHHAGLIDPNILAVLSVPSQREAATAQAAEQD